MKVKVKDLKPNPYRNMDKYPVDREKVDALIISIHETSFWDNLLAREQDGELQIAYGHHRLIALQELEVKTIDIPVKDIDDSMMIRIMANENMDHWKQSPSVILETIRATRDFLNSELAKYESWETLNESIKRLTDKHNFDKLKQSGVGQTTILKFLGGNWNQTRIGDALRALDAIEDKTIEEKVVTTLPKMGHVRKFTKEVADKKYSKEVQKRAAKEIKSRGSHVDDVPDIMEGVASKMGLAPKPVPKKKEVNVDNLLDEIKGSSDVLFNRLRELNTLFDEIGVAPFSKSSYSGLLMKSLARLNKEQEILMSKISK